MGGRQVTAPAFFWARLFCAFSIRYSQRMLRHFLWPVLLAVIAALGWFGWQHLPRAYNPFAPLHVADPLTPMTEFKLRRLRSNAEYCTAALTTAPLRTVPRPQAGSAQCPLPDVVQVQSAAIPLSSSFLASCPLAVSYAMWERHVLQPLAKQHMGQDVRRVTHLGSYACRNVRGGTRQSEHATANAIDISEIALGDGRNISVEKHWNDTGPAGTFLRALHKRSCDIFTMALGPAYDAAHHNHFHFGMGGRFGLCR